MRRAFLKRSSPYDVYPVWDDDPSLDHTGRSPIPRQLRLRLLDFASSVGSEATLRATSFYLNPNLLITARLGLDWLTWARGHSPSISFSKVR